jgi:hypothetical protein
MKISNEYRFALKRIVTIIAVLVLSALFALLSINTDDATFATRYFVICCLSIFFAVANRGTNKILSQQNTSTGKILIDFLRSSFPSVFDWLEQKSFKRKKALRDWKGDA